MFSLLLVASLATPGKIYCYKDTVICGVTATAGNETVIIGPLEYVMHLANDLKIEYREISHEEWNQQKHVLGDLEIENLEIEMPPYCEGDNINFNS